MANQLGMVLLGSCWNPHHIELRPECAAKRGFAHDLKVAGLAPRIPMSPKLTRWMSISQMPAIFNNRQIA